MRTFTRSKGKIHRSSCDCNVLRSPYFNPRTRGLNRLVDKLAWTSSMRKEAYVNRSIAAAKNGDKNELISEIKQDSIFMETVIPYLEDFLGCDSLTTEENEFINLIKN